MKTIPLPSGDVAIVDDQDFEELSKYKWRVKINNNGTKYAHRHQYINGVNGTRTTVKMHRQILNAPKGMDVDHINRDGLDNRRCNIRLCTRSQNMMNVGTTSNNTSGIKGVYYSKQHACWCCTITINGKQKSMRWFNNKEEAQAAYIRVGVAHYGEFFSAS